MKAPQTKTMFKLAMHQNFGCLVAFYGNVSANQRNNVKELGKLIGACSDENLALRHKGNLEFIKNEAPIILSRSVFLMAYAQFEEFLAHLCKRLGGKKTLLRDSKGYGLGRYKTFLKAVCPGNRLCSADDWQRICDAERVRHLLIHANGNMSICREKDKPAIQAIVKKYRRDLRWEHNVKLVMEERFLRDFVEAAKSFLHSVLDQLP